MKRVGAALAAVLVLAACTRGEPEPKAFDGFPGATWTEIHPGQAGFKRPALTAIDRDLRVRNSSCFVVTRKGKLVHEAYFRGHDPESVGSAYSMTKSFTSILFGIAVDQGKLSLDDKASKYITQWQGTPSENITVHDLLANCPDVTGTSPRTTGRWRSGCPTRRRSPSDSKQDEPPGTKWEYNNSAIQTLQVVLKKATGVEPTDYAQQYIFDPLGMSNTTWEKDGAGNSMMFSGIVSTCLDMARFGLHDASTRRVEGQADRLRRVRQGGHHAGRRSSTPPTGCSGGSTTRDRCSVRTWLSTAARVAQPDTERLARAHRRTRSGPSVRDAR